MLCPLEPKDEQDQARVEALRLQEAVDKAERAERKAEDVVKQISQCHIRKQGVRQQSIEKMKKQMRMLEDRVNKEEADHRKSLEEERNLQRLKKEMAVEARAARVKAERELQEHPYINALNYSRKCPVCLNTNPPRRAVLVACGHMLCNLCADELQKTTTSNESPRVCCPLCRKETTYVKVFEDLQTSQVRQSESRGTRKRVTDEDSRRETISVHQKQRKFVISCQNNLNSQSQARPNLPIQLLVSTLESRSLLPRSPLDPRSISLYRDNSDESPPAPHWHTLADELYDESPYLDLDE
ncbi:hypothetical protein PRIPAC_87246 [Pristionchus pacificus]|uniref:RING-type domain-containing protein n=1 Tax=Pristionchus pacificus TaxID=54126 RepID=A0A2A6CUW0_PRIPA|nr:hypothetical protein PRIPAC_87246 [Pristionchus pacificus]|eukprot:PDM82024.1 hypothetical protein PRIPAC_36417 [Pristionchus pacificus]